MKVFKGKNFAEAYRNSLEDLLNNSEYETSPRGMNIKENINTVLEIQNPLDCLYTNSRRSSQFKYISAEILWYFTGRNDLEFIEKYSSFWRQIANNDGTLNSAYGNLIFKENEHGFSQFGWAMKSLIDDKDSRQALMTFNRPAYQYENNRDFICTLNGIFNIRENRLNLTINMRSNDAILGTPTDVAFFCLLLNQAYKLLKNYYPELELGTYTHIANSYHIYERHFKLVEDMLKDNFKPERFVDLDLDLIDIDGNATQDFLKLMEYVENSDYYQTSDNFFKWINYQCVE